MVESIFRFARNMVDCLKYMRTLKELGIAIIFGEQSLNKMTFFLKRYGNFYIVCYNVN